MRNQKKHWLGASWIVFVCFFLFYLSGMLIKYDVKTDDVIRTRPPLNRPAKKTADKISPLSPAHENKKGEKKKKQRRKSNSKFVLKCFNDLMVMKTEMSLTRCFLSARR